LALLTLGDAKRELIDTQEKLNDMPVPEWFFLREKTGYLSIHIIRIQTGSKNRICFPYDVFPYGGF